MNAKGGGVAIFVKHKFQYKIREDLSIFDEGLFESVFIEVSINNKNVVIGEIYRPPNSNINQFIERYSNLIMKITDEKKEFFIGSDHDLYLIKYEAFSLPESPHFWLQHSCTNCIIEMSMMSKILFLCTGAQKYTF